MKRCDYLLVLSPPRNFEKFVSSEKRFAKRIIGRFDSMGSIGHITITNFFNKNDYQIEPQFNSLQRKISTLPRLNLRINGYDYFESTGGKTIYIKPIVGKFEQEWFNQISDHVKRSEIVPHITIAKGISDEQFDKLWPIFKDKECSDSFFVDYLTILKRNTYGPDNYYIIFKKLKFKNERLLAPFVYKNRKRRSAPRNSFWGIQTFLF